MLRKLSEEDWIERITDWVASADPVIPLPASSARGRSGEEVCWGCPGRRSVAGRRAWRWLVSSKNLVRTIVRPLNAKGGPKHFWKLT